METSQTPPARVDLIPAAREQMPVIANLLELYAYDFSEFMDLKLGENGRFGYPSLPLYWEEAGRHPFLIRVNGHWAGFALVRRGSQLSDDEKVWDMAEFFIVRGCRRRSVGTRAAAAIWNRFPGRWEVRVRGRNEKAREFWGEAIRDFTGKTAQSTPFEMDSTDWHLFSFESQAKA